MYNFKINRDLSKVIRTIVLTTSIFNNIDSYGSVDHKTPELYSYLQQISGNQSEKSDNFVDIIKNNRQGTYLDIGSGRDTIPNIIQHISHGNIENVRLIAGDLEGKTLAEIAKMYPQLLDLDDKSPLKLSLARMDATEMHKIPDSSVKAINASAVLHEVNSYVPSKTPIDRFFLESIRVLEKNGFLIYRDPTLQSEPDKINDLVLTSDFAKKFATLFLPKFLDTKLTKIVDMHGRSIKPNFDYQNKINFKLYLKNDDNPVNLNFTEFFALPTNAIDFNKNITINGSRRLLSELQRHYILFVKNVYPVNFINENKIIPGTSLLSSTPKLAKNSVESYVKNLGINFNKNMTKMDIDNLKAEKVKIDNITEQGIYIDKIKKIDYSKLVKFFGMYHIPSDLYNISNDKIWLDAKLVPIVYNHFPEIISTNDMPLESLKWLQREGEEYYFYYTTGELLNYLEKFCDYYLKGTDKEGYMLSPASTSAIKYIDRSLYKNVLERDMVQLSESGKKQEFVTSKTIIIFQLNKSDSNTTYTSKTSTKKSIFAYK